ncbi:hypothetical protein ABPG75_013437 [Micractinium tetrahymenae]
MALAKSLVAQLRLGPAPRVWSFRTAQPVCRVLEALKDGQVTYRDSGRLIKKHGEQGPYANGAVMRISPVGLAYRCFLAGVSEPEIASPLELIQRLQPLVEPSSEMGRRLKHIANAVSQLPPGSDGDAVRSDVWEGCSKDSAWKVDRRLLDKVISDRGAKFYWQIKAVDAVASALWALCRHWGHGMAIVQGAVHQGGDADTVGAIAGALAGAQNGVGWVPQRWWDLLEQQVTHPRSGARALVDIAVKLAELDVRGSRVSGRDED